jgi:hypothetical protein
VITTLPMAEAGPLTETVARSLDGNAGEIPGLQAAVAALTADQQALSGWLRSFDDPAAAALVAASSYWHHNGFAKLVLHTARDFRVRMHVWPAGQQRLGETNPHGHRWNFVSQVLCGDGLSSDIYQESDSGGSYVKYSYFGGLNTLVEDGGVSLRIVDSSVVRTHQRHSVDTTITHTVHPLGTNLVATIVVQGAPCVDFTAVYCAPDKPVDEPIMAITPNEVQGLIHDVLVAIGEH